MVKIDDPMTIEDCTVIDAQEKTAEHKETGAQTKIEEIRGSLKRNSEQKTRSDAIEISQSFHKSLESEEKPF